jgi:hypothetical protein
LAHQAPVHGALEMSAMQRKRQAVADPLKLADTPGGPQDLPHADQ